MKNILTITLFTSLSLFVACTAKKSGTTTATASIIPTETQLKAIQAKYPEVSMQTLTNGHAIYTGVCTNCHGQKNIFKRSEESWKHEIDDMAPKAKITDAQKDDLYKYILAMKATQAAATK